MLYGFRKGLQRWLIVFFISVLFGLLFTYDRPSLQWSMTGVAQPILAALPMAILPMFFYFVYCIRKSWLAISFMIFSLGLLEYKLYKGSYAIFWGFGVFLFFWVTIYRFFVALRNAVKATNSGSSSREDDMGGNDEPLFESRRGPGIGLVIGKKDITGVMVMPRDD